MPTIPLGKSIARPEQSTTPLQPIFSTNEGEQTDQAKEAAMRPLVSSLQSQLRVPHFVPTPSAAQIISEANLDALFNGKNKKFSTKQEGRLPTLYFKTGNLNGRILQEHEDGPAILWHRGALNQYFFPTHDDAAKFSGAYLRAAEKSELPPSASDFNGTKIPTQDYFLYEIQSRPVDGIKKGFFIHTSGGQVQLSDGYNNDAIKEMRKNITKIEPLGNIASPIVL